MTPAHAVRFGVAASLAYEAYAIATGRSPTVSKLCRRRWPLIVGVPAAVFLHLWRQA